MPKWLRQPSWPRLPLSTPIRKTMGKRSAAAFRLPTRLLRPVFDPQVWDAREVALIIRHERRLLHKRMRGNPEIMIRDHFTAPCEIGFDSTEPLGNRWSERQEFHPCEESAVPA